MIRIFRHYIPKSLIVLGFLEFVVLVSSAWVAVELRELMDFGDEWTVISVPSLIPSAIIMSLLMQGVMGSMGLYGRQMRDGAAGLLVRIALSFAGGFLVIAAVFYLIPDLYLGRGVLGIYLLIALFGLLSSRFIFLHFVNYEQLKKRIVVLGTGRVAEHIGRLKRKSDWRGINVMGYISIDNEEVAVPKEKVLYLDEPLKEYVNRNRVDGIVVALSDRRNRFPVDEILDCKMAGTDIEDVLSFFERHMGKIKLDFLHPSWLIFSDGFMAGTARHYLKRVFDITISLIVLALAWPLMLLAVVAIYIEEGFRVPVLYRQVRVGYLGKPFEILKFRSMSVDAEKDGKAQWAQKQDPRVTKVGGFIRKVRIDELPQLFNVLKGEMSFVGPRPERPQFVKELAEEIPYFEERHRVKPGLTGWAQINYPYGASVEDSKEKLQYDLYYAKNYSVFLDLLILFQTAQVVLFGKGR